MTEGAIGVLCLAGPAAWMIGGSGPKWVRRFLWPVVVWLVLLFDNPHVYGIGGALLMLSLMAVNTLPYGEHFTWRKKIYRLRWWLRIPILMSLGLPGVWIAWHPTWLIVGYSTAFLSVLFWLSRRLNAVSWKLWECAAGFCQAATLVTATLAR